MTEETKTQRGRKAPTISVRLTYDEHAEIKRAARGTNLSRYVRRKLFAEDGDEVQGSTLSKADHLEGEQRLSSIERQRYLARALAKLGDSNLHETMKVIADAARNGLLQLTPDVTADIRAATEHIAEIRRALMRGLGLRPGGSDDPER